MDPSNFRKFIMKRSHHIIPKASVIWDAAALVVVVLTGINNVHSNVLLFKIVSSFKFIFSILSVRCQPLIISFNVMFFNCANPTPPSPPRTHKAPPPPSGGTRVVPCSRP